MEFLKKCDLFGYEFRLNYKKKSQFQTYYGGIVSLTLLGFCALFMIYVYSNTTYIQNYYQQDRLAIINPYKNKFDQIQLDSSDYFIAVGFRDGENYTFKENYKLDIIVNLVHRYENQINSTRLIFDKCKQNIAVDQVDDDQILYQLDNFRCLYFDQSSLKKVQIYGQQEDVEQQFLEINFQKCENGSNLLNSTCSQDELTKKVTGRIIMPNYQLSQDMSLTVQKTYLRYQAQDFVLDPTNQQMIKTDILLKGLEIQESYFLRDLKQINSFQFSKINLERKYFVQSIQDSKNNFSQQIKIRSNPFYTQIKIQYFSYYQFINFVGSYYQFYFFLGYILIKRFNKYSFFFAYLTSVNDIRIYKGGQAHTNECYDRLNYEITPFIYIKQFFSKEQYQKKKIFTKIIQYTEENLNFENLKTTQSDVQNIIYILFGTQFNNVLNNLNKRIINIKLSDVKSNQSENFTQIILRQQKIRRQTAQLGDLQKQQFNILKNDKSKKISIAQQHLLESNRLKQDYYLIKDLIENFPNFEHYQEKILQLLLDKINNYEEKQSDKNQVQNNDIFIPPQENEDDLGYEYQSMRNKHINEFKEIKVKIDKQSQSQTLPQFGQVDQRQDRNLNQTQNIRSSL